MDYELVERAPTVDEYLALREQVGWAGLQDREAVARGLAHSVFAVCVERDGALAGTGRLVGDGGVYAYVQDVIVVPGERGRGLARLIMDALMRFVDETYPPGAFIGLENYQEMFTDDDVFWQALWNTLGIIASAPAGIVVALAPGIAIVLSVLTLNILGDRLTMIAMDRPKIAPGDPVKLTVEAANVHVFETGTGMRIGNKPN